MTEFPTAKQNCSSAIGISGSMLRATVFREVPVFARFGLPALFCVLAAPGLTADYPFMTMLYGTKDHDQLTVDCYTKSETEITCDFTQVHITKAENPEDLQKELNEIDKMVDQEKKQSNNTSYKKSCIQINKLYETIISDKVPPEPYKNALEDAKRASPKAVDDIKSLLSAIGNFCKAPSRETAEALIRIGHEKQSRTCNVGSHNFSQNFILDTNMNWVSKEGPEGECGTIMVSTFKKVKDRDYSLALWTYTTQKIITNKDGGLVFKCSDCDRDEHFYDWEGEEKFLGCDYIKFCFQ
jgi:hypothetical protein